MPERMQYYIELVIEACGFDGSDGNAILGWSVVAIAAGLVIAAFYIWITRSLWPGEQASDHIKRRILLEDGEVSHAD